MILKILFFTFAISFVSTHSYDINTYISDVTEGDICIEQGAICHNCTTTAFCFKVSDDEFHKEILDTCPEDMTCKNGYCTAEGNEACGSPIFNYKFTCYQPGVFPDPYDCKKYHICSYDEENDFVPNDSSVVNCVTGFGYDIARGVCRIVLKDNECPGQLLEPCTGIRSGPVPGNPNMYYICLPEVTEDELIYVPRFFHCDKNYEYHDGCRDPHPEGVVDGVCTEIGNFYDEDNCTRFYECREIGELSRARTCQFGYKFNPITEVCEAFTCSN